MHENKSQLEAVVTSASAYCWMIWDDFVSIWSEISIPDTFVFRPSIRTQLVALGYTSTDDPTGDLLLNLIRLLGYRTRQRPKVVPRVVELID